MTWMTSQCMIALRNKTVAHKFLSSLDNANSRLYQDSESGYHGNVTSHFSLLGRLNLKVEKELVIFSSLQAISKNISHQKCKLIAGWQKCKAIL